MSKLFLDDVRYPQDVWRNTIDPDYEFDQEWIIVRTYDAFVSYIEVKGLPDLISFDHDLSFDHYLEVNQNQIDYNTFTEKTGYHAAQWLVDYCLDKDLPLPRCKVHSMNVEGKGNIERILRLE
jgi:hypothetical protein